MLDIVNPDPGLGRGWGIGSNVLYVYSILYSRKNHQIKFCQY